MTEEPLPWARERFAHARGATIELCNQLSGQSWVNAFGPAFRPGTEYRIKPGQEHLQYGPLSTELRSIALDPEWPGGVPWHDDAYPSVNWLTGVVSIPLWEGVWADFDFRDEAHSAYSDIGRMFYLFIAELLADYGM